MDGMMREYMNDNYVNQLSRMDRKKIDLRNRIIDTTVGLIRTRGYDGTTMEQIASDTDIAKKTLYNYYPDKDSIISDYIKRTFAAKNPVRLPYLQSLADTRSRVVYILDNLMDGVRVQKDIFEKYLVYVMKQVVSFQPYEGNDSGIGALIAAVVALGIEEGDIRGDLPPTMAGDFFTFIFIEIAKQFYMDPANFQQNEVIEQCADLFMNGVKPAVKQGVKRNAQRKK